MPFTSTKDYYDPFPGLQIGLQIGHNIAQQRYQDEATKIAERRTAAYEQEQTRLQAKQALEADKIAREMQAETDFQNTFKGLLNQEINALPPEARGDEKELNAANRRAYLKAIPYMPAGKLPATMNSAMSQEASTQRNEATVQGRLDALNSRLDSQEYVAELKNDAKGVSEDEYVNRHLNAHAKQANLPMEQADADLRRIYRNTHGTKKDGEAEDKPDPIADTLGQLERAKSAGVKRVKVTPDGGVQAVDPSVGNLWMGGDPIDDVIRKVERDAQIKGIQAPEKKTAPAAGKSTRVFKYDPKTGGIKK